MEENIHLATIGFGKKGSAGERLKWWNAYLSAHGLPEVDTVGSGLQDTLRRRNDDEHIAAAILLFLVRWGRA